MKLHPFVRAVSALRFANTFNPYADRCPLHDRADAPSRRADALSAMLESALAEPVEAIWLGRDLGYRGGRRTGLAFTDDVNVSRHARRWACSAMRPTIGDAIHERTAAIVWGLLDGIDCKVFLWNVFPLHPHEPHAPFTNRQHNAKERAVGEEILAVLVTLLRPSRIVAVGNDAHVSAERVAAGSTPVARVRHPSYGGQTEFRSQIATLYGLVPQLPPTPLLAVGT